MNPRVIALMTAVFLASSLVFFKSYKSRYSLKFGDNLEDLKAKMGYVDLIVPKKPLSLPVFHY